VSLLVGGTYFDAHLDSQTRQPVYDTRNVAYFFGPTGLPGGRYDKVHLVPWGEFIPFKQTIPWLYQLFLRLSPYTYDYTLTPGRLEDLTIFNLSDAAGKSAGAWRFVVPICFEDIDAGLVEKMLRPGSRDGRKRADFIVNITNDGWFKANEQPQHLQVAVFRSIENRVPTARSVNTGISGFIDSVGRIDRTRLIAQDTEGYSVATLSLDSRTTLFTRYGEVFGIFCAIATAAVAMGTLGRWAMRRRAGKKNASP
jgi:apolipoprotein N-acyltransferase